MESNARNISHPLYKANNLDLTRFNKTPIVKVKKKLKSKLYRKCPNCKGILLNFESKSSDPNHSYWKKLWCKKCRREFKFKDIQPIKEI